MSIKGIRVETPITDSLTLVSGPWPATLDAPDGAVIMLRKKHGGQITLSAEDWQALWDYIIRNGT